MLTEEQFNTAHRFDSYQKYLEFLQISEDPGYPIAVVAKIMGLQPGWLKDRTRQWEYAAARHLACWIAQHYLEHSTVDAARLVGYDNHCMSIYAKRRVYRALQGYDYKLQPYAEKAKIYYDELFTTISNESTQ